MSQCAQIPPQHRVPPRPDPAARRLRRLASVSTLFTSITCLLGLIVLMGWALDISILKSVVPGVVSMKPNTALAFTAAGLALWSLRPPTTSSRARATGYAFAGLTTLIGGVTLLQYASGLNLGIDTALFAEPPGAPGTLFPGRMAMATAAAFVLTGASLLLLNIRAGFGWVWLLPVLAGAMAMLNALGYVYHARNPTAMHAYTQMAVHTAAGFLILVAGILCARPDRGLMASITSCGIGGAMARTLLPAAIIIPPLLGWVRWAGQRTGHYDEEYGLAIGTVLNMAAFGVLIWLNARFLNRADARRREAEHRLHGLNEDLDARVHERTTQLEAAVSELEAFSYSVSHDVRAPLRAVDGFSRIVMEEHADQLDPEGRRILDLVRTNAKNMGLLIDHLLALSRLNRVSLAKTTVDPADVVRRAWDDLLPEREGRNVDLQVNDLPLCAAEPTLLKQVFQNLLSNALKFTRPRDRALIQVTATTDNGRTTYGVRDNGVGFDQQYADKLFGVFQRLHRAEDFEGTGVGLALVQRIVRRHGGRVWASGAVDQGAVFSFTLEGAHEHERAIDFQSADRDLVGRGQSQ